MINVRGEYEPEEKTVRTHDGTAIAYQIYRGEPGKPAILLVHGVGGDLDSWGFIADQLLPHGFTVIAPDLRGHGHSEHPREHHKYKKEHLVSDIAYVLDAEEIDSAVVVGHSFGATVAFHFADTHPRRTEKLVVLCPTDQEPGYMQSPAMRKLADSVITLGALISPPAVGPWRSPYPEGKHHKDYETYGLLRTIFRNSLRSYLLSARETIQPDIDGVLESLTMPTLIVAGEEDSLSTEDIVRSIHARVPGSEFALIRGANHPVVMNNPDEVTELILTFLSRS